MNFNIIAIVISVAAILISFYAVILINDKKKKANKGSGEAFNSKPLQLQAYERLVMLAERISIPNLVSRANQPGLTARDMQRLLLDSIKQEYEYNTTQQIYVSPTSWDVIKNLKDQNMLIINQVGSSMPSEASGTDFNKRLLEFTMNSKKGMIHEIVLEALNYEAKKVMK